MKNLTVKGIKQQAQAIKDSGTTGAMAWSRLGLYCKSFKNVDFNNGCVVIFIRDCYKSLCRDIGYTSFDSEKEKIKEQRVYHYEYWDDKPN